jgi:hypothetical protein
VHRTGRPGHYARRNPGFRAEYWPAWSESCDPARQLRADQCATGARSVRGGLAGQLRPWGLYNSNISLPSTPASALAGAMGTQRFELEAAYFLVAVPPKNRMIAKPAESRMFRVPPQPHQSERAIDEPILIAPGNRTFIAS